MQTIHRQATGTVGIRLAEPHEAALVRGIDDKVFPEDSEDLQRAPAGDLEEGVDAKDVYLFGLDGRTVAYLHVNRMDPERVYLSGFGVLPELQNRGLGTAMARLAEPILAEYEHKLPIYTVTSPRNARLLHLLFNLRFAGRWVLPDYFGPGRHRIGCQLLRQASSLKERERIREVKVTDIGELSRLVSGGWLIRDQRPDPAGQVFELAAGGDGDFLDCPPPGSAAAGARQRPQPPFMT